MQPNHWDYLGFEKQSFIGDPISSTGEWVGISIRDGGTGLKKEDLERIFAPFEQADNSASRRFLGTGLGLSLTRQLVELHGGKIWAESDGEGKGSSFFLVIPVQPWAENRPPA